MPQEKSRGFYFDIEKWRGSRAVQRMSFSERGVYLEMMIEQWDKRYLTDDSTVIADQIASTDDQIAEVQAAWETVRKKFVTGSSGRIFNAALERTRRVQAANRRKREISGQKGGKASAANRNTDKSLRASNAVAPLESAVANSSVEKRVVESSREEKREREDPGASLSPAALHDPRRDPFTDPIVTERAGRFVERYQELYPKHRSGARYALKPARDYAAAVTLCQTWTDDTRLDKLAVLFLTTDHRFAEEGSRTIPQFLALASWCDGRLAEWEKKRSAS